MNTSTVPFGISGTPKHDLVRVIGIKWNTFAVITQRVSGTTLFQNSDDTTRYKLRVLVPLENLVDHPYLHKNVFAENDSAKLVNQL